MKDDIQFDRMFVMTTPLEGDGLQEVEVPKELAEMMRDYDFVKAMQCVDGANLVTTYFFRELPRGITGFG